MKQETLVRLISECCISAHLAYDNSPPVKVIPGVWKFWAVELNENCSKSGHCREKSYYAIEKGQILQLI